MTAEELKTAHRSDIQARPKVGRPCGTCPFRQANHGKPTPDFAAVNAWEDRGGWYGLWNLRRAWLGIRDGEAFNCHSVDPDQNNRVVSDEQRGTVCVGALYLVMRDLNEYGKLIDAGEDGEAHFRPRLFERLTKEGALRWSMRIQFAGVPFFGDGMIVPRSVEDYEDIVLPTQLHGTVRSIIRRAFNGFLP